MYTGKHIREVVREHRFEKEMALIHPNAKRADEFLEGAERILSRMPEAGYPVDGSNIWFIDGHTVDLALYYTFDTNRVYFLSIKKIPPPQL